MPALDGLVESAAGKLQFGQVAQSNGLVTELDSAAVADRVLEGVDGDGLLTQKTVNRGLLAGVVGLMMGADSDPWLGVTFESRLGRSEMLLSADPVSCSGVRHGGLTVQKCLDLRWGWGGLVVNYSFWPLVGCPRRSALAPSIAGPGHLSSAEVGHSARL
ncbi:hypothetical protein E1264_30595 [Actinomadura sp. KC216]|uniref:hypothetical protein n=1 Tax=Actinomadura sp. KC216 TaxID=2530370 RepID=UPI0010539495|nr:hypothetical protein [Actinomadura sp. KC216]TDB82908.1 hypothetical protein E1264_30595 [Actinomadura sp. KC216]